MEAILHISKRRRRMKRVTLLYKSMAAKPRTPAPKTGAAVRAAKPLDVEDDCEFWLFEPPVPVAL